jgi:ADP-heptose:LPS heptosyltransferase
MPPENVSAVPLSPIVIRLGSLGDMINLSSLLRFLHRRYGMPCVVIGAGPWNEPVYRGNPDVARVWSLDRYVPFLLQASGWRLMAALRRSNPAPIYICDDDKRLPRVQRLLRLSGVDRGRCVFISSATPRADEHHVDSLMRFGERTPAALRAERYPVPAATPACARLPRDLDPERAELGAWITAQGWSGRQLILVQPGNRRTMSTRRERHRRLNRDDKAWPEQRWIELFHRIHARVPQALIMLCGARQEVPMLRQLRAAANLEAVVVASLALRPFFALCEAAHSMISIDTGPAHAAAAMDLPLVVIFGGQRQNRWLPRSSSGTPVIGLGGPPIASHVNQIPVDAVFDAWCSLADQIPLQRPRVRRDPVVPAQQRALTGR